jgi:LacI family transcriptional regulator
MGSEMDEPTIADVARCAGVSSSTVSRHLMGQQVRAKEAIDAAVVALGYRPSPIAQSLRSGKTFTIAVVVPDISNPFFGGVVKGAESIARTRGYSLALYNTDESADVESDIVDRLHGRVDGIILVPSVESDTAPLRLREYGVPVVFLDREITGPSLFDTVLVDNEGGTRQAVSHLLNLGHRRVGVIRGPVASTPARSRYESFRETLSLHGLNPDEAPCEDGDFRESGGHQAMLRLLARPHPPTGVFVCNNEMTVGALRALRDLGIVIPDEMSLVGFDDHALAALLMPPLTVVDRPVDEQGAIAMRLLLRRLSGSTDEPPRRIVLETNLVVRGSTAPPPGSDSQIAAKVSRTTDVVRSAQPSPTPNRRPQ